jgi:hypothetical protein
MESSVPSSSRRSSIAASSRRSSTAAAASDEEEVRSGDDLHESGFDADRSNNMNDTTLNGASKSGRASNASARSSVGGSASAAAATPANSRLSRSGGATNSLLLTAPSAGSASKAASTGKRVSFSGGLGGLSPISGQTSQPPTGGSKRTSFASSIAPSSADRSAVSAAQSDHAADYHDDDFGDHGGDYDDGYEDDDAVDASQRMMSQTDTPTTSGKSISRSGAGSMMRTPYSEQDADSTLRSAETSRRLSLPTPGSRDYVRGTRLPDETYIEDSSEGVETDEEGDTSAVITPAAGKFVFWRKLQRHTVCSSPVLNACRAENAACRYNMLFVSTQVASAVANSKTRTRPR